MCDPATLMLVSAGVSAVGTGIATAQSMASARYQQRIAERNAALSNEAAQTEQANNRQEALRRYRELAALKGQQRVSMAANSVDLGFGNAARVLDDTEMVGREDMQNIYNQGYQRSRGFEIEASNFRAGAQAAKQARTGALVSGLTQIGTTVLGGASQYKTMKAGRS